MNQAINHWLTTFDTNFLYTGKKALMACWDRYSNVNGDNVEI
jgi:hypothetical protein